MSVSTIFNDFVEFVLDQKISHQKLTGVYHTDFEKIGAMPVQSSDYPIIISIIKVLHLKGTENIIDVGSGFGRFLGYLRLKGHTGKLLGIEIDPTYAKFSKYIFKKYDNIQILNADALQINLPQDYIAYLYNPFNEKLLDNFLSKNNFPLIIYSNDISRDVFKKHKNYTLYKRYFSHLNDGTLVPISIYKSISNKIGQ